MRIFKINAIVALVSLAAVAGACGMPDAPTSGAPPQRNAMHSGGLLDLPLNSRCAYNFQCSQEDAIPATQTSSARAVVCRARGYDKMEKHCLHQGSHELISGWQRCDNDADCVDWLVCANQIFGDGSCEPLPQAEEQRGCTRTTPCRCASGHCRQYGSAHCDGGHCLQICDRDRECSFTCNGGGCVHLCAEGAVCLLGCQGQDCVTECAQTAACGLLGS